MPDVSLVLALQFARAEKSEASRRAYRTDFELFSRWRERNWDPTFSILGDSPPLKWSDLRYVFDIKEDCNGKEAIQA